jgi:hypothetical protein
VAGLQLAHVLALAVGQPQSALADALDGTLVQHTKLIRYPVSLGRRCEPLAVGQSSYAAGAQAAR